MKGFALFLFVFSCGVCYFQSEGHRRINVRLPNSSSTFSGESQPEITDELRRNNPVEANEGNLEFASKPNNRNLENRFAKSAKGNSANRKRKLRRRKKTNRETSREKRRKAMRAAMQELFGFNNAKPNDTADNATMSNSSGSPATVHVTRLVNASLQAPDFMLDLHHLYNRDESFMIQKSKAQGNTIRSYFSLTGDNRRNRPKPLHIIPHLNSRVRNPSRARDNTSERMLAFAFNLTSIPASESVIRAELRAAGLKEFALTRSSSRGINATKRSTKTAEVAVYKLLKSNGEERREIYRRIGSSTSIRASRNFRWINHKLLRMVNAARQRRRLVIVRFSVATGSASDGSQSFDRFRRLPPFFSIDESDLKFQNRVSTLETENPFSDEDTGSSLLPAIIVYCNDTKTLASSPYERLSRGLWKKMRNLTSSTKLKRSRRLAKHLLNKAAAPRSGEVSNAFPGESSSEPPRDFSSLTYNGQTELEDNGIADRRVMQSLRDHKAMSKRRQKKRSRKCRRRRGKGKRGRKCRTHRKKPRKATPEADLNRAKHVCSRSSLRVDFSEIGWSDWIISPKYYDAFYCSGDCRFNTIKSSSASNHAIIQSFINEFEFNREIPAPCCVPSSLTSLSVLYFDQNDSVVLKVYPHMSVERCACR